MSTVSRPELADLVTSGVDLDARLESDQDASSMGKTPPC
jgi:hypothetical protein